MRYGLLSVIVGRRLRGWLGTALVIAFVSAGFSFHLETPFDPVEVAAAGDPGVHRHCPEPSTNGGDPAAAGHAVGCCLNLCAPALPVVHVAHTAVVFRDDRLRLVVAQVTVSYPTEAPFRPPRFAS